MEPDYVETHVHEDVPGEPVLTTVDPPLKCCRCKQPAEVKVMYDGDFITRTFMLPMDEQKNDVLFGAMDRACDPYTTVYCRPCLNKARKEEEED